MTITELKNSILDYLLNAADTEDAMNYVLETLGSYFNAGRAYIYEISKDGLSRLNSYEWYKDGLKRENIESQDFSWHQDDDGSLQCAIEVRDEKWGIIGLNNCPDAQQNPATNKDAKEILSYTSRLFSLYVLGNRHNADMHANRERAMAKELQEANDTFEELLANISCGLVIFRVTPSGLVLDYANKGFCNLVGKTEDEIFSAYKNDALFLVDTQYKNEVYKVLKEAVVQLCPATSVFSVREFTGKNLWLMAKANSIKKEDGEKAVFVTYFDITREVETTFELQKKYEFEKQRRRDDDSTVAYAVFNLSSNETLEMERRRPLLPLKHKLPFSDFRDDIAANINSEEMKNMFLGIFNKNILISKYNDGIEEQTIEFQRTMPNGKVIWVKSTFHVIMEPSGRNTLLVYSCNDVNMRKSLEIMTSYITGDDYDMIGCINFYDDSAIMLYGKNSSYNLSAEEGIRREENYSDALEWFVDNAVVPEEREMYRAYSFVNKIKSELHKNGNYEFIIHLNGENGQRLTKKTRYTSYDAESQICFFTQIDITSLLEKEEKQQRKLQTALDEANKATRAKSDFLSRMSHEIRTPMNCIIGMTKLAEGEATDSTILGYLKDIDDSSQYLLGLLNDVLDMSRIENSSFELNRQWASIASVLLPCISMMKPILENKGIEFLYPVIEKNASIEFYVDTLRMKQVIMNLLNNAAKFTPKGGTIEISIKNLEAGDRYATDILTIRDTGCGMSKDFISKSIFEPFSQEQNSYSSSVQGTGLGLALVREIVNLMEGSIKVESELGKGTAFYIKIPYEYRMVNKAKIEKENDETNISELGGKRILLAEDHPLNRKIATKLLEREGIVVEQALNGLEALQLFR